METNGELSTHLTIGAVIVYALQWLKSAGWFPWLTADTKSISRLVSIGLALVAAIGINWSYDPASGDLLIHGLRWSTVLLTGWETLKQFCTQQMIYDGVVQKGSK